MASFSKLLSSVLIALLYSSTTNANPWPLTSKHTTHRQGFGVEGLDHPLARRAGDFDIKAASVSFLASKLGIQQNDIHFRTSAKAEVAQHAFLKQQINGVPVANAVANVAFSDDGKVLSFGSSFVKPTLDGTHNGHPATLEFLIQPDGSAVLTHVIQIQNEAAGTWVQAFVDAHANKVVSVTDFVAKASTLTDPQDLTASSLGWHNDGTTSTTTTAGNNVFAAKGSTATSQSSATLNFIYTQNAAQAPTVAVNVAAAVVNAFYIVNTVHDVTYRYGFTESTFNFQTNNFGKGGAGNDRVTLWAFLTQSSGQSGHMRMFLWDFTSPGRDGALENDIVIHENTHGVTNRMTGGGTGSCLQTTEAGGMGEGWSDTMADWASQGATTVDFVLGQYVINPAGIRSHPYSTSALGEVWANMLHNVYASLVTAHGWSATARTNPGGTEGNIVFLHLFLDALLLQPCNPTYADGEWIVLTARNAWIQADANRFAGEQVLAVESIREQGLGVNAANHNDDSTVPAGC
ncbi:Fungalysin metallopeptidase-domain-containing protein [Lactarius indigo]|nr:Fungalysin metallopeptidase-domain-containing protein [Lactarius indigo]